MVTRQSSKASAAGSEATGPSAITLDSGFPSDYEESPTLENTRRRRATTLVVYAPSGIIEDPSNARASKLREKDMGSIALKHGIPRESLLLPTEDQRVYNPPEGYIAWSRYHCTAGGIPSLNGFLINFFNHIECAHF